MKKATWTFSSLGIALALAGCPTGGSRGHGGGEGEGESLRDPVVTDGDYVPESWTCEDAWWDADDGCDCGCGARDPDCDDPDQSVLWCGAGQSCDWAGRCTVGAESSAWVPASWTCPDSYYDAQDGCDCNCGARDPDCDDPGQSVLWCEAGQTCDWAGRCAGGGGGGGGGGLSSDACSECLDTCHGLPSCCTGTGCMCEDECAPTPSSCAPGTTFCCGPYDCMCLQNCPY